MEHHARCTDGIRGRLARILDHRGRPRSAGWLHPPTTGLISAELVAGAFELPDLAATGSEQLRVLIRRLEATEHELSYHRRILHAKIDLLRAELVDRLRREDRPGP